LQKTALTLLKQNKRQEEYVETRSNEYSFGGEITDIIERVLSEDEKKILILHVLWGYKHREIAQELSCPTGTVTSKYKRAIEKLRKELEEVK
jgi:RNA polymerase sigma-70 factor (ECF subfamily)